MHALHQVFHSFFNLHSFTLAMPDVWAGFQINLRMMVVAEALVLVLALALALIRGLPGPAAKPLRALAIAYTDFFRGTPIIIVAFFIGFGLPGLQLSFISNRSITTYGVIVLTLVYTAYVTEVYRAGIESVHPSQRAAARSLGLTYMQAMRYVVVPQAVCKRTRRSYRSSVSSKLHRRLRGFRPSSTISSPISSLPASSS
jgi:polar amino acid transport system permease protein